MRVSVILGNPRPQSFCHAIANTATAQLRAAGHATILHDLQAEGFDPVATADEVETRISNDALVERHCVELAEAEGLIVIHPVWWAGPPAILKGWIDRVVRRGVAYDVVTSNDDNRMGHIGRLRVRAAIVFNTADTPPDIEEKVFRDPVGSLWHNYIAAMCGIPALERQVFRVMATSTEEARAAWLASVAQTVARLFPATESSA
jgi:NAD(P)H dehydrogenase (quinone)